jgi:hypothetical protein
MAFDDLLSLFGGTGVGQLYDNMAVPGLPQMTPPSPEGLLGGNPQADMPAPNAQVAQYIIPGSGQSIPAGTTAPPAAPPPGLIPPKPMTVARDPDASNPVLDGSGRIPNQGGGPDERTVSPPPIVPPKIDLTKPTSSGTTVPGQAAPPAVAAPGAAPAVAAPGAAKPGEPGFLDKLNKAVAGMPALGGAQKQLTPANIGSAGQPHIPQGGAQLMQQLLEAQAKAVPIPGKVPGLPGVMSKRIQGLI